MLTSRRHVFVGLLGLAAIGCSSPGSEHEESRRTAYASYGEGLTAFKAKDYPSAEGKLTAAIEARGLNPDVKCDAVVMRAICWAKSSKYDDALADLEKLGPSASNIDQVFAARSYILAKQGKAAESRAALAKARQYNRTVQEFKY